LIYDGILEDIQAATSLLAAFSQHSRGHQEDIDPHVVAVMGHPSIERRR